MPDSSDQSEQSRIDEQAIHWYVRLRADNLTDGEIEQFADWMDQDPGHARAFTKIERLHDDMVTAARSLEPDADYSRPPPRPEADSAATHPRSRGISRTPTGLHWLPGGMIAALVLAILVLPRIEPGDLSASRGTIFSTANGELKSVRLEDGSELTLNTGTSVSVDLRPDLRTIFLQSGQARFDVAADTGRPFEVVTADFRVRALGTAFEVYASPSGSVQVTVEEHAVSVRRSPGRSAAGSKPEPEFTIHEGYRWDFQPDRQTTEPYPVDLQQTAAWRDKRLIVSDRPLPELLNELQRYGNKTIYLYGDGLQKRRVTGVFSLDDPGHALQSICNALDLDQTHIGPWWVIVHR